MGFNSAFKGLIKKYSVKVLRAVRAKIRWPKVINMPVPMVELYKACLRSLVRIVSPNPAAGMDVCFVSVVCFQVEVIASA